ncbi:MAG TPA: EMC3/TMCO1 family protein [Thermoplasmata archaeon]|nr:EMC3/TMCO1 family protein [Thermoplasmata archaeon]
MADDEVEDSTDESADEGAEEAPNETDDASESASAEQAKPVLTARKQPVAPVRSTKGSFTRFMMIFLVLLAVVAIFDPTMSQGFGALAGYILFPVIGFGGSAPVLTLLIAGMMTTGISSILRDHYTDWIKMVRVQKTTGAWQRALREAMRKGNKSEVQKLNKIREGFMKEQMDVQVNSMKPLAWTFFLFIVLFAWLNVFVNQTLAITGGQYFAVPWATNVYVTYVPFLLPSWVLMYSLLALPVGQILTRVLKYVRFRRKLEALGLSLKPEGA